MKKTSDHKRLEQQIRALKAFILMLVVVVTLTIGEITGDPEIPSWSSVLFGSNMTQTISPSDVIIHAIDVGQGDCTLIQTRDCNILIDAGENGRGREVSDYLYKIGVKRLDLIVATHPHSDHMGGIDDVIEMTGADNILMVYLAEENSVKNDFYLSVLKAIEDNDVNVIYANEGDTYSFGNLSIEVIHPCYGEYRDDMNDISISLRITCGKFSMITCGDITYEVEEELLDEGRNLDADIYIANHHGSALSNSEEFISAISPEYVVFSCGENNSYNHPHSSVLKFIKNLDIEYYRTDLDGTVVISYIDGIYSVKSEK